jgi:signal transduction histidine kinase
MPYLPLGRLFWKFLIFFFLAQMTAVLGIGLAIWAIRAEHETEPSPPPFAAEAPAGAGQFAAPSFPPPLRPDGFRPPPRGPRLPIVHLLAGAVVSLIFAALLAAYVSRPIRRLRLALQAGASGRLVPGLSAAMGARRDELADLGRDFDRMAQHLAQLMAGQRRLLHDVSHELRSPLARLNAIIGLARQQPEALDDCLSRLEHESMRMDRLLSELLTLSRLESGTDERADELVDVSELLGDVADDAAPEAEQAACRIELAAGNGALVQGDPEMLHRAFDNLLRNALSHACCGGWVRIEVSLTSDEVTVSVEDRGPGVLSADIDRLFQPFFRGTAASSRSGHGLGLAIAKQIIDRHHGRIAATNRPEGGLRLGIVLARAAAPSKAADVPQCA